MAFTAGDLLVRSFELLGIGEIYGARLDSLRVMELNSEVAKLAAKAHTRMKNEGAAVHSGDGRMLLRGATTTGGSATRFEVQAPSELVDVVAHVLSERVLERGSVELALSMDLSSPSDVLPPQPPPGAADLHEPDDELLRAISAAGNVVVLCGPGAVRRGAVLGLHDLAAAGGLGVLNTWGAKGVFDWRSSHHLATAGLQRDDFVLGGLAEADLIVATGLDPLESPAERWTLSPHVVVAPESLSKLSEQWPLPRSAPVVPALREKLARVTQAGWQDTSLPLMPTRVTLNYSDALSAGGLVAADPGTAGFWVARTFSTTELGSVQVPAEADDPGLAVACCLIAGLSRRPSPALAVVDWPIAEEVVQVMEAGERLGVPISVEAWDPDGERIDADRHAERLREVTALRRHGIMRVATNRRQLEEIVDVAGPVVAWT